MISMLNALEQTRINDMVGLTGASQANARSHYSEWMDFHTLMCELERSPLEPINSAWANVLLVLVYANRHKIKVFFGSVALYA